MILTLLEKVTDFLLEYTQAFREIGAAGVIMAEPAAGLLSPRGLGKFSAPFVRRIVESVQNENFSLILHNCGARLVHLPKVLESGQRYIILALQWISLPRLPR
jgi:uroporphyrinogen decarboxylase